MHDNEELAYLNDAISTAESMDKLLRNKDFKKIFIEGYIKDDMVQLGMNITNLPSEKRNHIVEAMLARGIFKQYIDGLMSTGINAKQQLEQDGEDE
jgi:hypothetical protein